MPRYWFVSGLALILAVAAANPAVLAEESDTALPEQYLVITATRIPTSLLTTPVSTVVISKEDIEASGAATVAEALVNAPIPSMSLSSYSGNGVSQIHLRGAGADGVLVLLDGHPLNTLRGGGVDLSLISTANIERIEVVSGATSSVWGADATGGAINIITRKSAEEVSFRLGRGTANTQELQGLVPLNLLSGTGLITLDTAGSSGFSNPKYGFIPNSDYTRASLSGNFSWNTDKWTTLSAFFTETVKEAGNPGPISSPTPEDRQRDEALHLGITGTRFLGQGETLEGHLWGDKSLEVIDGIDSYTGPYHDRHDETTLGLETLWQTQESPTQKRLLGLEAKTSAMQSTRFENVPSALTWAAFWEENYTFPRLNLNVGSRLDGHSIYGQQFSPRFGAIYHLSSNLDLKGSVGKAFRAPSFMDLYAQYPAWNMYGNPDLNPEIDWSGELGLAYHFPRGGIDLTVFHRYSQDLFKWIMFPDSSYRPVNLSQARFWGGEAKYSYHLFGPLDTNLTYSWLKSRNEDTGKEVPYTPSQQIGLNLTWNTPRLQSRLGARFVGQQSDGYGNLIPPYGVMDLNLQGPINTKLGWFLRIENLLDENYQEVPDYPMPGRSITGGINLTF